MDRFFYSRLLSFLLVIFFWSAIYQVGVAQKYDFKRYSVTEGMPHTLVSTILEDNEGYMWFGTMGGGLSRFDGKIFKTFTRQNGLRDNTTNAVLEDSKNNFWVSTDQGGVGILQNDSLQYRFTEAPLDTVTVYSIKESPDGRIWFATYGAGIFIYDGESLKQLTIDDGLSSNYIWDFYFAQDGKVWVGTHYGLSILNEKDQSEGIKIDTITAESRIGGYAIYNFLEDSGGSLWFATNTGVTKYDGGEFETISELQNTTLGFTYSVIEDEEENIWIGTAENGIFRQFGGDTFYQITEANGLSSNYINTLYKNSGNKIWIGTNEDGANLYKGDMFVKVTNPSGGSGNWSLLSVTSTDDGRLWIGTEGNGLWTMLLNDSSFEPTRVGLDGREVWIIEPLQNGNFLLLMDDNSILEYDGVRFENYSRKVGLNPLPYTIDVFADSQNSVWIGTNEGLYRVSGGELKQYRKEDGLTDDFIWEITEHDGRIWVATNNGLNVFEGDSLNTFTAKDGLLYDVISTVILDESGDVWLGTPGGVTYMQRNKQTDSVNFINIDAAQGLQFVDTQLLEIDKNGFLWQGTNAGLQVFNTHSIKKGKQFPIGRFTFGDNNSGLEFAHKAVDTDPNGNIWFGSTNGLLRYDPDIFRSTLTGPVTKITGLQINFQENIDYDQIGVDGVISYDSTKNQARLAYDKNNLIFNFTALEFEDPESVSYRYRLKGFADQWREGGNIGIATFTNLEAWDYIFEVQAKNKYGVWGTTASFPFTVTPAFWNTYWFYLLMVALLLVVSYVGVRSWLKHIEASRLKSLVDRQTEELQKALEEKEVLIKEIHHRVKNNLAVISGLLELQLGYTENEHAEEVLKESQRRIFSISMIHEKLYQNEKLSEINFKNYVNELIDIITYSFSHLDKKIDTKVNVDEDIQLTIDQSIPCGLILNELVSNAYEHAFNGKGTGSIEILVTFKGKKILLQVTDNGVGMSEYPSEEPRNSLGITLVETLTQQLEGDLDVQTSASGSRFAIRFTKENTEA